MQVDDIGPFLVSHPKPVELVLNQIAAGIALGCESHVDVVGRKKVVAVIFHQSASTRGNPDETVTVEIDVGDIVAEQPIPHIQVGNVVMLTCKRSGY